MMLDANRDTSGASLAWSSSSCGSGSYGRCPSVRLDLLCCRLSRHMKVVFGMVLAVCVPVLYLLVPDLFYGKADLYAARNDTLE